MDERDLAAEKKWHYARLAEKAVAKLNKNNFQAVFATDREIALGIILELIPDGSTIGFADSVTMDQIGLFDQLHTRKPAEIFHPMLHDEEGNLAYPMEEVFELQRKVLTADVYICGTNAITLDGKLVSTDGGGNRVAPMIFGPKRTIFVAGANKIVPDVEAARERIKRVCAPINVKRHIEKHNVQGFFDDLPCAKTGFCADCNLPQRICAMTVIIECSGVSQLMSGEPKRVVIVGEELGI
jgi:L-lactate utilization protein LutB